MADRRSSSWSEYDKRVSEKQEAAKQIGYQPKERRTNAWKIADAEAAIEQYKANNIGLQNEQMLMDIEDRKKKMQEEEQKAKSKEMLDRLLRKSFETTESQNKKIDQRSPAFSEEQYIEREMKKAKQPVSREDALQKSDMVGKNIRDILGNAMLGKDTNLDANMSNYADQRQQERSAMQQPDTAMLDKLKASYKDTYLPGIEKQEAEKRSRLKSEFTPQFAKEQTESMATSSGYSDSSDVVRKSGVFGDEIMTPTIGEMTSRRTQQDEARKQIEQSEDPYVKQLMGTMETFSDDPKTLTALRKELGNYIAKKGIQEQGIDGKKNLQATAQSFKSEESLKDRVDRETRDEKEFQNEMKLVGIKANYDMAKTKYEEGMKTIRQKETEKVDNSKSDKKFQDASKWAINKIDNYSKDTKIALENIYSLEALVNSPPNGMTKPMILANIARGLAAEKGVLTDADIKRYNGSQALMDRFKQMFVEAETGMFSEDNLQYIRDLTKIIKLKKQENYRDLIDVVSSETSKAYNVEPDKVKDLFKSRLNFIDTGGNSNSNGELPRKRIVPPATQNSSPVTKLGATPSADEINRLSKEYDF
jgi:hypothetical protein